MASAPKLIPPAGERTLPVLSGVLLALACPPAPFLVPAFVGLVPLLVFIAERPAGPAGRWSATRAGLLTGLVYFGLQLYWFAVALAPYSGLALPAYLLSVAVLAALSGAFGWALHLTLERLRLPLALLAPILWTTLEWTQGRLGPFAFPWLGLGHALVPFPVLAGAADLVGARGLTLWIAGINALLATGLLAYRRGVAGDQRGPVVGRDVVAPATGRSVSPVAATAAAALLLFLLPAGYGHWRAATLELRPLARVAVVQPNIPQELRMDAGAALEPSLAALIRLSRAVDEDVDLVVWPEVALTVDLAGEPGLVGQVRAVSRAVGAPVLTGAYAAGDEGRLRNSAFLVDSLGSSGLRYDKRRLVPFVERVPLMAGRGRFGGLEPGLDGSLFQVSATGPAVGGGVVAVSGGGSFGVLICFESTFGDLARDYRRAGAGFLVNITNDAWFGGRGLVERTTALWQHPAHLTMRAIENRMGIARAANTGISLFVDPLGRTHGATAMFVAGHRVETVLGTREVTLFTRWGDWLATLAALASLALVVGAVARARPGRGGPTVAALLAAGPIVLATPAVAGLFLLTP